MTDLTAESEALLDDLPVLAPGFTVPAAQSTIRVVVAERLAAIEQAAADRATADLREALVPDLAGGMVWLGRDDWGDVIDGLVMLREQADSRKRVNSESTSDIRSAEIADLIGRIAEPLRRAVR